MVTISESPPHSSKTIKSTRIRINPHTRPTASALDEQGSRKLSINKIKKKALYESPTTHPLLLAACGYEEQWRRS